MVTTSDFDFGDPSSNLGRTFHFLSTSTVEECVKTFLFGLIQKKASFKRTKLLPCDDDYVHMMHRWCLQNKNAHVNDLASDPKLIKILIKRSRNLAVLFGYDWLKTDTTLINRCWFLKKHNIHTTDERISLKLTENSKCS